jgi:3-hydroxy-9,10-secoandrosta-1,3,5(10)-triene-9,17-dione monooxygenase reductase component
MDVGSERFRKVMGHFVTGVTVVTTFDRSGRPAGITVNALTSVSLEPPLVVVALDRRRFITPIVHEAGRFAVSILSEDQQGLSDCFAGAPVSPGRADFCGAAWTPGEGGLPILDGAIASLECTVTGSYPIGDHDLFIGRVDALTNEEHHPQPLLYYRRRYLRVDHGETLPIRGRQEG